MKGKLYDLSQKFQDGMTTTETLGPFQRTIIRDLDHNPCQISKVTFATHLGCHLDAPRHYYKDGESIGDISVDRLVSRCVVIDAQKGMHGLITIDDVQKSGFEIRKGDFVFFYTGWDKFFEENAPMFFEGASLSEDLARWLAETGVGMVGIDTCTVDLAHSQRTAAFDFAVHRTLLENGVLIAECLKLREVVGKELLAYVLPMYLAESDGAPIRVVASEL